MNRKHWPRRIAGLFLILALGCALFIPSTTRPPTTQAAPLMKPTARKTATPVSRATPSPTPGISDVTTRFDQGEFGFFTVAINHRAVDKSIGVNHAAQNGQYSVSFGDYKYWQADFSAEDLAMGAHIASGFPKITARWHLELGTDGTVIKNYLTVTAPLGKVTKMRPLP